MCVRPLGRHARQSFGGRENAGFGIGLSKEEELESGTSKARRLLGQVVSSCGHQFCEVHSFRRFFDASSSTIHNHVAKTSLGLALCRAYHSHSIILIPSAGTEYKVCARSNTYSNLLQLGEPFV